MSVQVINNSENVCPQDNVIQTFNSPAKKAVEQELSKEIVPTTTTTVQEPAPELNGNQNQVVEEEEVDEDEDEEEESESEEELQEDEVDDETFGEQTEVVAEPLSLEEEAKAAAQLAQSFGLESTDDALKLIGRSGGRRMTNVISQYSLHLTKEPEIVPFYDTLSEQINVLRQSIDTSLSKLASANGYTLAPAAIELLRGQMELFVREILRQGTVLTEYREAHEIATTDLLQALSNLGRPMYTKEVSTVIALDEDDEDPEDPEEDDGEYKEDGMDEDGMDEDENENEEGGWEAVSQQQQQQGNQGTFNEEEEGTSVTVFDKGSFKQVVDVLRTTMGMNSAGYEIIQSATENYVVSLMGDCTKSADFVGKKEIGGDEVRFVLKMTAKN